jgi:hypothetical protein
MLSLNERLEQINKLRKQAMDDPAFIHSARAHEKAILSESQSNQRSDKKSRKAQLRSFADIYAEPSINQARQETSH